MWSEDIFPVIEELAGVFDSAEKFVEELRRRGFDDEQVAKAFGMEEEWAAGEQELSELGAVTNVWTRLLDLLGPAAKTRPGWAIADMIEELEPPKREQARGLLRLATALDRDGWLQLQR